MANLKPPIELMLAEVSHKGHNFRTGLSVTFPYIHNKTSARSLGLSPQYLKQFQTEIEPAGKYMILDELGPLQKMPPEYERGNITLRNPLVIEFSGDGSGRYNTTSWKMRLYLYFKKQRGKALTAVLKAQGYDSIVTVGDRETSEIIKL